MDPSSKSASQSTMSCKTFFLDEKPLEYYSKEGLLSICAQTLAQNQETLRANFSINASSPYLSICASLLDKMKEDKSYINHNAEMLSFILPILFSHPEFVKSALPSQRLSKESQDALLKAQRKALKKSLNQQDMLRSMLAYVDLTLKKLNRSDGTSPFSAPEAFPDDKDWLSEISKTLDALYQQFHANVKVHDVKVARMPKCRTPILNTLINDPWRYPAHPVILSLAAVKEAFYGQTCAKKALLTPSSFDFWDTSAHHSNLFYQNGLRLAQSCSCMLETEFEYCYSPIRYPSSDTKKLAQTRPVLREWPFPQYSADTTDDNTFFVREIPFALPLCRFRELALDIEKHYAPGEHIAHLLIDCLPSVLYSVDFSKSKLPPTLKFNTEICDVLQVFHALTSPIFYHQTNTNFLARLKKTCQPLVRRGFLPDNQFESEQSACMFLTRYFVYDTFTEAGFALAFDFPRFRYRGEVLKYYEKYHEKLKNYLRNECSYGIIQNELMQDKGIYPSKKWALAIKETLSLSQATSILKQCMINPPSDVATLSTSLSSILGPNASELQRYLKTVQNRPPALAAFCKLIYDETLDLIAQACIALLWHANIQLYTNNNSST